MHDNKDPYPTDPYATEMPIGISRTGDKVQGAGGSSNTQFQSSSVSIPGYDIVRLLGRGGMGAVYLAEQIGLNRQVAIKVIASGKFSDAEEISRFQAEAAAAAGLDHPGICSVYEVGHTNSENYYSMQYIEGQSLAQLMSQSKGIPIAKAVGWVQSISEAIEYAHRRGIVHRDLKPGNIMIDIQEKPHIVDFGLAKRYAATEGLTISGQVMGTPSYMAPEQAMGQSKSVGPAADVYSIGAILYELISGRRPFVAENLGDLLTLVRSAPAPLPRSINRRIPVDLQTICLKCLEKAPESRYSSAGEVVEELQRFLEGRPILARQISSTRRLLRWCNRNPLLTSFIILLVVATSGLSLLAFSLNAEAVRSRDSLRKQIAIINDLLVRFSEEELLKLPGAHDLRISLLTQARGYYEEASGQLGAEKHDDLDAQLNTFYGRLIYETSPESVNQARTKFQTAEKILIRLLDEPNRSDPKPIIQAYHPDRENPARMIRFMEKHSELDAVRLLRREALAKILQLQTEIEVKGNRFDSARTLFERSVEYRNEAVREFPDDLESKRLLASAYQNKAEFERKSAGIDRESQLVMIEKAIEIAKEGIQIRKELLNADSNFLKAKVDQATGFRLTARLHALKANYLEPFDLSSYESALKEFETSISLLKETFQGKGRIPSEFKVATTQRELAELIASDPLLKGIDSSSTDVDLERAEESLSKVKGLLIESEDLLWRIITLNPSVPIYKQEFAKTCLRLGQHYMSLSNRKQEAPTISELNERAISAVSQLSDEYPKEYGEDFLNACSFAMDAAFDLDDHEAAKVYQGKALEWLQLHAKDFPNSKEWEPRFVLDIPG